MNRLYKTYIMLRRIFEEADVGDFGARIGIDLEDYFNSTFNSYESEHIAFTDNVGPILKEMYSSLIVGSPLDLKHTRIILDNDTKINYEITSNEGLMIDSEIAFGEIDKFTSGLIPGVILDTSYKITFDEEVLKMTAGLTLTSSADVFSAYANIDFNLETPTEIDLKDADLYAFNLDANFELDSKVQFLSASELNLVPHINAECDLDYTSCTISYDADFIKADAQIDVEITPTTSIIISELNNFKFLAIFSDDIEVNTKIRRYVANVFTSVTQVDGGITPNTLVDNYEPDIVVSNVALDLDITSYATMGFIIGTVINFHLVFTDELDQEAEVLTYTANEFAYDVVNTIDTNDSYALKTYGVLITDFEVPVEIDLGANTKVTNYVATIFKYRIAQGLNAKATASITFMDTDTFNFLALFTDELDANASLDSLDADMLIYTFAFNDELVVGAETTSSEAEEVDVDILVNGEIIESEISIDEWPMSEFTYEVEVDGDIIPTTSMMFRNPTMFETEFDISDFKIDVHTPMTIVTAPMTYFAYHAIFDDELYLQSKYDLYTASMMLVDDDAYVNVDSYMNVERATGELARVDTDAHVEASLDSYVDAHSSDKFNFDLVHVGLSDMFANMFVQNQSVLLPFYINNDGTSELTAQTTLSIADDISFSDAYHTEFDSTLLLGSYNDFRFNLQEIEKFDSTLTSYDCDTFKPNLLHTLIEDTHSELSSNTSLGYKAQIINRIVKDIFTAGVYTTDPAVTFNVLINNTIVKDTFDSVFNVGTSSLVDLDTDANLDTEYTSKVNANTADFAKYHLSIGDILDKFTTKNINTYTSVNLSKSNLDVDFDLDMSSELSIVATDYLDLQHPRIVLDMPFGTTAKAVSSTSNAIITNMLLDYPITPTLRPLNWNADLLDAYINIDCPILGPNSTVSLENYAEINTSITIVGNAPVESYFVYSTYAKLNEYDGSANTLNSMGSSTLTELSYHKHSYN